ncbi:MAG: hypothetical protein HRT88_02445 [Lentisphaeraceae bacterium]|nr:hypothetical protein [Lentisphaeraceae bacterium]
MPDQSNEKKLSEERKYLEERVDARVTFLVLFLSASSLAINTISRVQPDLTFLAFITSFVFARLLSLSVIRTQRLVMMIIERMRSECPDHPYIVATRKITFPPHAGFFTGYAVPIFLLVVYIALGFIFSWLN